MGEGNFHSCFFILTVFEFINSTVMSDRQLSPSSKFKEKKRKDFFFFFFFSSFRFTEQPSRKYGEFSYISGPNGAQPLLLPTSHPRMRTHLAQWLGRSFPRRGLDAESEPRKNEQLEAVTKLHRKAFRERKSECVHILHLPSGARFLMAETGPSGASSIAHAHFKPLLTSCLLPPYRLERVSRASPTVTGEEVRSACIRSWQGRVWTNH